MMFKSGCQIVLILKLSVEVVLPKAKHPGPRQATLWWCQSLWSMRVKERDVGTEIPISDLNGLCVKLGIKGFMDKKYQFLGEYHVVMKSLTVALDILQGITVSIHTLEVSDV